MDESLINEIVLIEAENMTPILAASGLEFEPDRLRENLEKPQEIVTVFSKAGLAGFFRYSVDKVGVATVFSIQMKNPKQNKMLFYKLLKKSALHMQIKKVLLIKTVVQKGNTLSLKMHRGLGFKVVKEFEKAIHFEMYLKDLLVKLKNFY